MNNHRNICILVANSSEAKLFTVNKLKFLTGKDKLSLLQECAHPESRMKDNDLASDKMGYFQGKAGGHGSFVEKTSPKVHEAEVFAKELVDILDSRRVSGHFTEIVLVAPPQFTGLMNKHTHSPLKHCIKQTIGKDYTKERSKELEELLKKQL